MIKIIAFSVFGYFSIILYFPSDNPKLPKDNNTSYIQHKHQSTTPSSASVQNQPVSAASNQQNAQRRSRSRTRSQESSNLMPSSNLTLTSNDPHTSALSAYNCHQQNHTSAMQTRSDPHPMKNILPCNNNSSSAATDHLCQNESAKASDVQSSSSSFDLSKRVVNRVESLRQFLLHGRTTNHQDANAGTLGDTNGIGNGMAPHFNPHHHHPHHPNFVGALPSSNPAVAAGNHTTCSCRHPSNGGGGGGIPSQGLSFAHRQAAYLAAAAPGPAHQFRPAGGGMAHTRRRSKSSERIGGGGGGGPPRLSIAAAPPTAAAAAAYMAAAAAAMANGSNPHHQLFATPPPFLFAAFNPQEVVRYAI